MTVKVHMMHPCVRHSVYLFKNKAACFDDVHVTCCTGESRTPSLSTAMASLTPPPPHCPSKRKYGEEQMDDRINCDDDHMTKMSRLFATQL